MGFFKDVGNKLKRVVSLKNVVRGVTGNFSAVGEDVKRVMTTPDPKKVVAVQPVNSLTDPQFTIPQPVQDVLVSEGIKYQDTLAQKLGANKSVQDANTLFTKVWFQSQWQKYKNLIIGVGAVASAFLLWRFVFAKKSNRRRSR